MKQLLALILLIINPVTYGMLLLRIQEWSLDTLRPKKFYKSSCDDYDCECREC